MTRKKIDDELDAVNLENYFFFKNGQNMSKNYKYSYNSNR